ncbi:MAG: polysaccharide biosynthesis protein [Bacteroidales bacterium]|nr:polysaccharide biosynthesis protein [Bacteroidales bacterium]
MGKLNKYFHQYLNAKIVFAIDLVLSVLSSAFALLTLAFFASWDYYKGVFALWWIVSSLIGTVGGMLLFKTYKVVVRHTTLKDVMSYIWMLVIKILVMALVIWIACVMNSRVVLALTYDFLFTLFLLIGVRLVMFIAYDVYKKKAKELNNRQRVLVYGISDKSTAAITRLQNSPHYHVVGFLSPDVQNKHLKISDLPVYVYQNDEDLDSIVDAHSVRCILFATEADVLKENNRLVDYCTEHKLRSLIVPTIDELDGHRSLKERVRDVKIEDLLGRPEIKISMDEIVKNFNGKVVMVTGAAGSIGSELCRQLATFGVKKLVLFDNAETPMHNLRLELEARYPTLDFVPIIGDVRHPKRLDYAFRDHKPQVVFHAAAYKHVPLMEENPCEAILVNLFGSRNVANKCLEYNTEMMVMISTDKAVNPTNIMGCSKRLAEIYVQSLGLAVEQGKMKGNTKFVTTRFGNVLGSNGSVIPRFREQIANGGPVTVTHPEITRFFMTIPEACRLVMEAATMSSGNQIFVFDMGESVKIDTLARRMIKLAGLEVGKDIEIQYTGLRPGEKLYEEVLSDHENTLPTKHDRIRIAKVREYEYEHVNSVLSDLTDLARAVDIPEMVKLMKKTVPEFISQNSRFMIYDNQQEDKSE